MDFELRDDIWDDIDDEKLVFASNFVSGELGKVISTNIFPFLHTNYSTGYYLRINYYGIQLIELLEIFG